MKKCVSTGVYAIALPVISVFVCLILVEAVGRASGLLSAPSRIGRFSPTKGYELTPGQRGINSYGLRDREYLAQKPPNTYRIVVVGDSFTYGHGVETADTYVKQLESLLNNTASRKGIAYEVLNLGVPGYNTRQEFIHFNEVGMQFDPDLVLLQFTLNDVEQGVLGMKDPGKRIWLIRLKEWIKNHFAIYDVLRVRIKRLIYRVEAARLGEQAEDTSIRPLKQAALGQITPAWESCRQALAEFAQTASSRNIPLVLVIYPLMQDLDAHYPFKSLHKLVADTAKGYKLAVVDLLSDFVGSDAEALWVSPNDRHPNASAHAIAADSIYRFLLSQKLYY